MQRFVGRAAMVALAVVVVGHISAGARADAPESLRSAISLRFPGVDWVRVPQLRRWLASDRPPVLLDARRRDEFAVSRIRGARRIDPDDPDFDALRLPPGRIVVYCSVGWRSADIAQQLRARGRRDVYNLEGGIFAWVNRGHPVYRRGHRVRQVHPYDSLWGRFLRADHRAYHPNR